MSEPREPEELSAEGGWRARVRFWADILNKLAIPLLTVAGTVLTLAINERNNARATINQREQAESQLRSSMFSELVNPLIDQARLAEQPAQAQPGEPGTAEPGTQQGGGTTAARADRLTLLAELLALNFHEHFELGPLLRYVERLNGQSPENLRTLRSVARRVTGRQIAMLGRAEERPCPREKVREQVLHFESLKLATAAGQPASGLSCFLYPPKGETQAVPTLECDASRAPDMSRTWQPLMTVSPDCRDELIISLVDLDWDRQTLGVFISVASQNPGSGKVASQTETLDFTLSPYSLPFSDNTLLRSGNRFGLYVRQVEPDARACKERGCSEADRFMVLSFLWFPEDFYPPRERPTDFARVRRALNISE